MGEPTESPDLAEVPELKARGRVAIKKHPALPGELEGVSRDTMGVSLPHSGLTSALWALLQEFVNVYSSRGKKTGQKWYLFYMDTETGIPEEEQVRYRSIIQMNQLSLSRALVIREDELQNVGLEVREVVQTFSVIYQ